MVKMKLYGRTVTIKNRKVTVSDRDKLLTEVLQDVIDHLPDIHSAATPNPDGWAAHKLIERFGCGSIVDDDYEPGESLPGVVY